MIFYLTKLAELRRSDDKLVRNKKLEMIWKRSLVTCFEGPYWN
jgi:hypothetical protein